MLPLRRLRPALALVAATAVIAVIPAANAAAATTNVDIVLKGKKLKFEGPKTIKSGNKLKVTNDTDPKDIGPHTFSLVKPSVLPTIKSEKDFDRCFAPKALCTDILKAHEANFKKETIDKPIVDVKRKGWDKQFTNRKVGDSWFTEAKGETHSRKFRVKPGKTVGFFCAIHPDLQGTINVK